MAAAESLPCNRHRDRDRDSLPFDFAPLGLLVVLRHQLLAAQACTREQRGHQTSNRPLRWRRPSSEDEEQCDDDDDEVI